MKVVVAQKGSREHFLVARALHRQDMLAQLIVDWYPPAGLLGRFLPMAFGKPCEELPREKIAAMNTLGLQFRWRQRAATRTGNPHAAFLATDAMFARRIAARRLPPHDAFFGYAYASLEALEAARDRGTLAVVDQIDPGFPEQQLVEAEARAWPQLALPSPPVPPAYFDRARREWQIADIIVVNSEWTRELLRQDGAPDSKIAVLPLAYEPPIAPAPRQHANRPLRILWLGSVSLRKGIQYLIEAARQLTDAPVEFHIAGPLHIRHKALDTAPANMRWLGHIPAANATALYAASDLFVLPTISDGFAITQLEALAHGLPVVVTPNCARVVEDGATGFVVPPRDPTALAEALLRFVRDPQLLETMSPRCIRRAREFSIDRYSRQLATLLQERIQ